MDSEMPSPEFSVVVTGMGAVSALGYGCNVMWEAIREGRDGIESIERFTTEDFSIKLGAFVPGSNTALLEDEETALRTLCLNFAAAAGREALDQARIEPLHSKAHRIGIVIGTSLGDLESPLNTLGEALATELSITGPVVTISTACSSSTNALGLAYDLLKDGAVDAVLAGGSDVLSPQVFSGFHGLGVLSPQKCAPFSQPMGTTLGEGAGFLVLETSEEAARRGVVPLVELSGYGLSSDAFHETSPDPSGAGVSRAVTSALRQAGIEPDAIGYVSVHGSGTAANDRAEWQALEQIFGDHARTLPFSSVKSHLGHAQGAAGVLETIATILAMQHESVPPTLHFAGSRPYCSGDSVNQDRPRELVYQRAVCTNSAFWGANAAVTISRCVSNHKREAPRRNVSVRGLGMVGAPPDFFSSERSDYRNEGSHAMPLYDVTSVVPTADPRGVDELSALLTIAAAYALEDGGLKIRGPLRDRAGLVVGTTKVSPTKGYEFRKSIEERGLARCSVTAFSRIVLNAPAGSCSKWLSLRGPTSTLTTGWGSGLMAIIYAAQLLSARSDVDVLLAGGMDVEVEYSEGCIPENGAAGCMLLTSDNFSDDHTSESISVAGWGISGPDFLDDAVDRALSMAEIEREATDLFFGTRDCSYACRVEGASFIGVTGWGESASSALACVAAVTALRKKRAETVMIVSDEGKSVSCALLLQRRGA